MSQRPGCFNTRAVFRCTAHFARRADFGGLRATPAFSAAMISDSSFPAAAIHHNKVNGGVAHSPVKDLTRQCR